MWCEMLEVPARQLIHFSPQSLVGLVEATDSTVTGCRKYKITLTSNSRITIDYLNSLTR